MSTHVACELLRTDMGDSSECDRAPEHVTAAKLSMYQLLIDHDGVGMEWEWKVCAPAAAGRAGRRQSHVISHGPC